MKNTFLGIIFTLVSQLVFAGGNHQAKEGPIVKTNGAVTAHSEEDGFKLSDRAMHNLGVAFQAFHGSQPWTIPSSALVHVKRSTGVYRLWDGWITMVLVDVVKKDGDKVSIKSVDLEPGDEIAVSGAFFLRMTDADLNSDTVDSCTH